MFFLGSCGFSKPRIDYYKSKVFKTQEKYLILVKILYQQRQTLN
jgi:hypothetical protein